MIPEIITSFSEAMSFINTVLPVMQPEIHAGSDGLDRLRTLLGRLGNPQDAHKAVHIAGTSGKGTIAYSVDALLRANGLRTGLTISPFVYDVRERFQCNGRYFLDVEVVAALNDILPHLRELAEQGQLTSRFETFMALTFYLFAKKDLDYIVVETGLGGLMDASNVMNRKDKVVVLSAIGFDHMHILGDTLEDIASQKAGIMQAGTQAFSYMQESAVMRAFEQRALEVEARLTIAPALDYTLPDKAILGGVVNGRNIELATAAVMYVQQRDGWEFTASPVSVLRQLRLPGRFEEVATTCGAHVILDGAHNPQKMAALTQHLSLLGHDQWGVVLTLNTDVDSEAVVQLLQPLAGEFVQAVYPGDFITIKTSIDSEAFTSVVQATGKKAITGLSYEGIAAHIAQHELRHWVVCGSFYNLAPIKKALMLQ